MSTKEQALEAPTQFDYLLHTMECAGQEKNPAEHGYAEARRALFAYVRGLESTATAITTRQPAKLNAIGQLVQRLAEQQPPHWCLIGPDGRCWLGADPLMLAAKATSS